MTNRLEERRLRDEYEADMRERAKEEMTITPETLRKLADRYDNEFDMPLRSNTSKALRQAADEIERLQALDAKAGDLRFLYDGRKGASSIIALAAPTICAAASRVTRP